MSNYIVYLKAGRKKKIIVCVITQLALLRDTNLVTISLLNINVNIILQIYVL